MENELKAKVTKTVKLPEQVVNEIIRLGHGSFTAGIIVCLNYAEILKDSIFIQSIDDHVQSELNKMSPNKE